MNEQGKEALRLQILFVVETYTHVSAAMEKPDAEEADPNWYLDTLYQILNQYVFLIKDMEEQGVKVDGLIDTLTLAEF